MKERSDREKDQVATLVAEIEEIKSKWAAETADLTGNIKLLQN